MYFLLERKVRAFSKFKSFFGLALFDCCRSFIKPDELRGVTDLGNEKGNFYITFGCEPQGGVKKQSTLALAYSKHLREHAAANGGKVLIPHAMQDFTNID